MVFKFLTLPPFVQEKIASKMWYDDYASFKQTSREVSWIVPSTRLFLKIQEVHVNDEALVSIRGQEHVPLNDILLHVPTKLGIVNLLCTNLTNEVCERLTDLFRRSQTKIARVCVVMSNCSTENFSRLLQTTGVFDLTVYMYFGENPDFSMDGYQNLMHLLIDSDVNSKFYELRASSIKLIDHSTQGADIGRFFNEWNEGRRRITRLALTCMKVHPNLHDQYIHGVAWNQSLFEKSSLSKKISFDQLDTLKAFAVFACNQKMEKIVVYIMHGRIRAERVNSEEEAYEELTKEVYLF